MLILSAKTRKEVGKKVKKLREKEILPAVFYGPKIKENLSLEVDLKEFEKVYKETGESALISLKIEGQSKQGENLVLVHNLVRDPLTGKPIHADFFQPPLDEEIEAAVPLIFEGEAPAVKDLGGTLVKNISEVEVKAFPQKLPKEIKVNVESLSTFEDNILIKDLKLSEGVKILKDPEEIIASVSLPEKVEEELEKPVEEKVEEAGKAEEKRGEEAGESR
jgi:large subunit ribosomal protein L25